MTPARFAGVAALILAQALAQSASAAELPSRRDHASSKPEAQRHCVIDGVAGLALDNGTCLHIGGYVSGSVAAGNLKSH